jgi:plastocyanin
VTRTIALKYAAAGLTLAGLALAACGGGDDDDSADAGLSGSEVRTINIEMRDNVFSPGQVDVEADETVRLVFRNEGAVTHDAFIGDEAAQEAHEMEMRDAEESGDTDGTDTGDDASHDMDMGEEADDEAAADEGSPWRPARVAR